MHFHILNTVIKKIYVVIHNNCLRINDNFIVKNELHNFVYSEVYSELVISLYCFRGRQGNRQYGLFGWWRCASVSGERGDQQPIR